MDSVFIPPGRRLFLFRPFIREEAFGVEWTGDLPLIRIQGSIVQGLSS